MIQFILPALAALIFTLPAAAQSKVEERIKELERRQEELEAQQSEMYLRMAERGDQVSTFFANKFKFGAFAETGANYLTGDDMGDVLSANIHLVGLNLAAEFNDHIRFVAQLASALGFTFTNPHNNPAVGTGHRRYGNVTGITVPLQSYVEYSKIRGFNVQMGLGYTPFGHAMQLREPVLFHRRGGPQMASSGGTSTVGVATPLWMGVHLLGSFAIKEGAVGYNAYTFTTATNTSAMGEGVRAWWAPSAKFKFGVSGQTGKESNREYYAHGFDVDVKLDGWGVTAEYAHNSTGGGAPSPTSYYIEPYVAVMNGTWLFYAVADYLNNPGYAQGATPDPYEKWMTGGGVNWLPLSYTRFRLGYLYNDYIGDTRRIAGQGRDYHSVDASAAVTF